MTPLELAGVAVALGFDAFSVALGVGVCWTDFRSRFRLSWHFGLFQALMPLIGWLAGRQIMPYIESWDHWFVFVVLMAIAVKMFYESIKRDDDEAEPTCNPTKGWMMVGLSVAVSIDALGVGLTFGRMQKGQCFYIAIIGITAIVMTAAGMILASTAAGRSGKWAERFGAFILGFVAFKLLLEGL